MKMITNKKEIERAQLERFISIYESFPDGEINEGEEPDFIVNNANKCIGIELTDLYWEAPKDTIPEQAKESIRYRISNKAQSLHEKHGLPNAYITIHFNSRKTFTKSIVDSLSTKIFNLVKSNMPNEGNKYEESYDWENRSYFPEEIDRISIYRLKEIDHVFYSAPNFAFIPDLESNIIINTLNKKDLKCAKYREKCAEQWLVMSASDTFMSSVFDVTDQILEHVYNTAFDKLFLVMQSEGKYYELQTTNNNA